MPTHRQRTRTPHPLQDLIAELEAARAASISFNPITALSAAKALRAVLAREGLVLPEAELAAICEQAGGDLRNALNTLQFVCTGQAPADGPRPASRPRPGTKRKAASDGSAAEAQAAAARARVAFAGRDGMLSLFHALGKLLYNKRKPEAGARPTSSAPGSRGSGDEEPPGRGCKRHAGAKSGAALASPPASQQEHQQEHQQPDQMPSQPWTATGFWQGPRGAAVPAPDLPLAPWARRPPMQFDPEAVLAGASLDAGA